MSSYDNIAKAPFYRTKKARMFGRWQKATSWILGRNAGGEWTVIDRGWN